MADEPEPSRRPLAVKLTWWNRAIFDVLGLAGLGAGGAAVFITHLEAGPVALIAAGLLLLLVGIGGHMPSRLKVGDNEAQWEIEREAVQVFVERVAEDAPAERQPELLNALGQLAESAPQVAAPALSGIAYETSIAAEIIGTGYKIEGVDQVSSLVSVGDIGEFDFVVEASRNRFVLIDAKASPRVSTEQIAATLEKAHFYRETYPDRKVGLLVISRYPLSAAARAMLQTSNTSWLLHRGAGEEGALIRAINTLLAGLG